MAVLTATFETGSNGNDISTGDAGSATAWNVLTISAGAGMTYSNTHAADGTLSAKLGVAAAQGQERMIWTTALGTVTDHYGRIYVWQDAFDSLRTQIIQFHASFDAAYGCAINITPTGKIQIWDSSNSQVGITTASMSTGQWVRLEWHIIHSTTVGMAEVKLFNTATSSTATETVTTAANKNFGASTNGAIFGYTAGVGTVGLITYVDAIVANAASYPGPIAVAPANTVAPVASGTGTIGQTLSCTTGTWTGTPTPTYTYQWQRDGVNIGSATASTYLLVTADGGTTVRCVVTATNTAGAVTANSNGISVAAPAASTGSGMNPGLLGYLYTHRRS